MASSPQKNLQFISPPKEAGDFLQNQVKLGDYNIGRTQDILTLPMYMGFLLDEA